LHQLLISNSIHLTRVAGGEIAEQFESAQKFSIPKHQMSNDFKIVVTHTHKTSPVIDTCGAVDAVKAETSFNDEQMTVTCRKCRMR
jgi:hypothetical protein